jgi:DNA-binding transcriptional LysR family regulator
MEMVRSAIVNGLGVGAVPDFMIEPQLASGVVQPLLGEYLKAPGQFQMVWTSGKQLSSKIRVFVDFISDFVTRQRQNGVHGVAAR